MMILDELKFYNKNKNLSQFVNLYKHKHKRVKNGYISYAYALFFIKLYKRGATWAKRPHINFPTVKAVYEKSPWLKIKTKRLPANIIKYILPYYEYLKEDQTKTLALYKCLKNKHNSIVPDYMRFLQDNKFHLELVEDLYKEYLDICPDNLMVHNNYATFLMSQQREFDAATILQPIWVDLKTKNQSIIKTLVASNLTIICLMKNPTQNLCDYLLQYKDALTEQRYWMCIIVYLLSVDRFKDAESVLPLFKTGMVLLMQSLIALYQKDFETTIEFYEQWKCWAANDYEECVGDQQIFYKPLTMFIFHHKSVDISGQSEFIKQLQTRLNVLLNHDNYAPGSAEYHKLERNFHNN